MFQNKLTKWRTKLRKNLPGIYASYINSKITRSWSSGLRNGYAAREIYFLGPSLAFRRLNDMHALNTNAGTSRWLRKPSPPLHGHYLVSSHCPLSPPPRQLQPSKLSQDLPAGGCETLLSHARSFLTWLLSIFSNVEQVDCCQEEGPQLSVRISPGLGPSWASRARILPLHYFCI